MARLSTQTTHANQPRWLERIGPAAYPTDVLHLSRYEFAAPFVAGKTVLDLACGVGFGARLLAARGASRVIGIDLDLPALRQGLAGMPAGDQYNHFVLADAIRTPLADHSSQVVVSFETIEHIRASGACLREFARVLTPDGLLILSTPNALVTRPIAGVPRNPFHVHEFEPAELAAALAPCFASVRLLGQRIRGTSAPPSAGGAPGPKSPLRRLIRLFPPAWRQALPLWLPPALGDALLLRATGHHLTPTVDDMEFSPDGVDEAPVLIALCRDGRQGSHSSYNSLLSR